MNLLVEFEDAIYDVRNEKAVVYSTCMREDGESINETVTSH